MGIYENRQQKKQNYANYRAAARRLSKCCNGQVSATSHIAESQGGAFVEVIVWVSDEEMQKERIPSLKKCDGNHAMPRCDDPECWQC